MDDDFNDTPLELTKLMTQDRALTGEKYKKIYNVDVETITPPIVLPRKRCPKDPQNRYSDGHFAPGNKANASNLHIRERDVVKLAELGATNREIADFLNCTKDVIHRRFSEKLKQVRSGIKLSLRQKQIRVAMEGNTQMLIWLGKVLLKQQEVSKIDVDVNNVIKQYMDRIPDEMLEKLDLEDIEDADIFDEDARDEDV